MTKEKQSPEAAKAPTFSMPMAPKVNYAAKGSIFQFNADVQSVQSLANDLFLRGGMLVGSPDPDLIKALHEAIDKLEANMINLRSLIPNP
jgi:hypothetical protein